MGEDTGLTPYTKIKVKGNTDINVKHKIYKVPRR